MEKTFTARFIDDDERARLGWRTTGDERCKVVEILAVCLNDEDAPAGGPARAYSKFDPVNAVLPKGKAVLSHRTWIDGRPADAGLDQLGRLKAVAGELKPY